MTEEQQQEYIFNISDEITTPITYFWIRYDLIIFRPYTKHITTQRFFSSQWLQSVSTFIHYITECPRHSQHAVHSANITKQMISLMHYLCSDISNAMRINLLFLTQPPAASIRVVSPAVSGL